MPANHGLHETMQMIQTLLEARGLDAQGDTDNEYPPRGVLILPDVHCARILLSILRRNTAGLPPELS